MGSLREIELTSALIAAAAVLTEERGEDFDHPRSQWEELIREWVFDPTDRQMLTERMFEGATFEELAERHHLSPQRAKARYYSAQAKLFAHA